MAVLDAEGNPNSDSRRPRRQPHVIGSTLHGGEPTPLTTGPAKTINRMSRRWKTTGVHERTPCMGAEDQRTLNGRRSNAHRRRSKRSIDVFTRWPPYHRTSVAPTRRWRLPSVPTGSDPRQLDGGRELNRPAALGPNGQDIYFFRCSLCSALRRHSFARRAGTALLSWDWQVENAPYFDSWDRIYRACTSATPRSTHFTARTSTVIHEVADGSRSHTAPTSHSPDRWSPTGDSVIGWQHHPEGGLPIIAICRVADGVLPTGCTGERTEMVPRRRSDLFHEGAGDYRCSSGLSRRTAATSGTSATSATFSVLARFFDVSRDGGGVGAVAAGPPGAMDGDDNDGEAMRVRAQVRDAGCRAGRGAGRGARGADAGRDGARSRHWSTSQPSRQRRQL